MRIALAAVGTALLTLPAWADEGGVGFWLPGRYASFAAIAPAPGVSLPMQTYYYGGNAGGDTALPQGGKLTFGLDTGFAAQFIAPTWTPDTRVLGGRPSFSLAFFPGWNTVSADVAVAGGQRFGRSDTTTGFGDLYPNAQLFWNSGVHNWMAYLTGNVPVGAYDASRLANLGLGHGAIDAGGAYTYLDRQTGWEFSATAGLTYNFENPDTDYTSGISSHLDLGFSRSLSEQFFLGLAGFAYVQLTPDEGQPDALGDFKSRTFGIGPQFGYTFEVAGRPVFTSLRGYVEFAVENRPEGGSLFLTVSLPLGPVAAATD
jgi:hypothetical protein